MCTSVARLGLDELSDGERRSNLQPLFVNLDKRHTEWWDPDGHLSRTVSHSRLTQSRPLDFPRIG